MDNNIQKKKKKGKNNKKKFIICLILLLVFALGYYIYDSFFNNNGKEVKVVDKIKNDKFDYVVNENDTKLFKTIFKDLKKELNKSKIDEKKYAELISKLFVVDFFNLNNKSSINDVGGVQFVYTSYKTDFVNEARNGIYKQVTNAIDSKKNRHLPEVTSVNVKSIEKINPSTEFKNDAFKNETTDNAYKVSLDWKYKNGYGFQDTATLIIVKDGKKLSVAKMTK